MYKVIFSPKAIKALGKIPKNYQAKIKESVNKLRSNPFSLHIKKMHQFSAATHRLRVGNYRLFLQIDTESKVIIIAAIRRRTSQTYR